MCAIHAKSIKNCVNTVLRYRAYYYSTVTHILLLHGNIFIVFKHPYILIYLPYDILSMRKRISSIFYTFPLVFNLFDWKSEISERLQNLRNLEIKKKIRTFYNKIWNLKFSKLLGKSEILKIWKSWHFLGKFWKYEKCRWFWKKITKSENLKKSRNVWKTKSQCFSFFIEKNMCFQDFEEKIFWALLHV